MRNDKEYMISKKKKTTLGILCGMLMLCMAAGCDSSADTTAEAKESEAIVQSTEITDNSLQNHITAEELFDALGVEYSLDESGNFEAFHPDVNMERMTYEQKVALAEKYKGVNKVGNYHICINLGETPNEFVFYIQDKDAKSIYLEDNYCTSAVTYINKDGDFYTIGY